MQTSKFKIAVTFRAHVVRGVFANADSLNSLRVLINAELGFHATRIDKCAVGGVKAIREFVDKAIRRLSAPRPGEYTCDGLQYIMTVSDPNIPDAKPIKCYAPDAVRITITVSE